MHSFGALAHNHSLQERQLISYQLSTKQGPKPLFPHPFVLAKSAFLRPLGPSFILLLPPQQLASERAAQRTSLTREIDEIAHSAQLE